jgi:hypothetical protein
MKLERPSNAGLTANGSMRWGVVITILGGVVAYGESIRALAHVGGDGVRA